MNKYIGITIGPIFETINMAGTPAALWAASYMFSMLSKTVCETLVEKGVAEEDIIAPYYKKGDPLLSKNDGIGLFHDRIVFRSGNFDITEFAHHCPEELFICGIKIIGSFIILCGINIPLLCVYLINNIFFISVVCYQILE